MRCVDVCLLEAPEGDSLPLDDFLARLRRCDECPHAESVDPVVRVLLARMREAAKAQRRAQAQIRKLEHEASEVAAELERYDAQLVKLERLQRVSSDEMEAALAQQVARVREQEREIEALAVPIIHAWNGVFVLPIIGNLTSARARVLTERLLEEVARAQTHTAIIDVTGVGDIDTATADHLIQMVSALRLLGAEPILTGVTAEIARALVDLGVELAGITTVRNVRQALLQHLRSVHAPE